MKRLKIKLTTDDQSMIIPLKGIAGLSGYDDDVSAALRDETDSSINQETDAETRRILPSQSYTIRFAFYNTGSSSYEFEVAPNEFTGTTDFNTIAAKNSFYVIQLFDTFKDEIQSKKHTGYFNGFDFAKTGLTSIYAYTPETEFSNLYIAQPVLDSITATTGGTFYVKYLFYSGKSGKFYSFSATTTPALTTQESLYHRITIDPNMLSYTFQNNFSGSTIILRELRNADYNTFINNTVESIPVEKPVYPAGNTFDDSGNYVTI